MPTVCMICESIIRDDIQQGAKDKPICRKCALVDIPKALAFVKSYSENIGGIKSESIGIKSRKH